VLFSSSVFLFQFLPLVLALYYIFFRGRRGAQNLLLLVASLFFYAWGEPRFLFIMVLSIAMNYGFGLWVYRWKQQCRYLTTPIAAAVSCNLALLFVFKYLVFTVESLNCLGLVIPVPGIALPIGISFFTFQALSYVLDVASGKAEVQRSPLALGLYISFFPQLIAGPIVKYASVAQQIDGRKETWADFSAGCVRFLTGLGKKVLIANQMAVVADRVFAMDPAALSTPMAWLGALCYTFQIYYDFSGYSDMAIGMGRMFGFHFLENFDHPYVSASIQEFWRRWHISLSSWFRDYLYIPLGGNRKGKLRTELNKCIVFFCTGLWHGASWNFVLWGLWHGLFMILEGFLPKGGKLRRILGHASTLLIVLLGFVLFRADTLSDAGLVFAKMFAGTEITLQSTALLRSMLTPYNLFILSLSVVFSLPLLPRVKRFAGGSGMAPALLRIGSYGVSAALFALCIMNLAGSQFNPFIYFRF